VEAGGGDPDSAAFLALEVFDDTEFDLRTPADWMLLGEVNGVMKGVPAFTLDLVTPAAGEGESGFVWKPCTVLRYEEAAERFHCVLDGGQMAAVAVPRIFLQFVAEDPANFAARVAVGAPFPANL
jgi:hypothetical protein